MIVVPTLDDSVNVGLMLFNQNGQRSLLQWRLHPLRDAADERDQPGRSAGRAQQPLANFSDPLNKAASNASYSMALFDAFKYFGGYTSPAHATDDVAGTPTGCDPLRADGLRHACQAPSTARTRSVTARWNLHGVRPPAAAADVCGGKNYIIFIGNGFPNS